MRFTFESTVWLWEGDAGWHFVTVPEAISEEIRAMQDGPRRGFGAVRTSVRVGTTEWQTSMFPDSKVGCYILPVKKAVRVREKLEDGTAVSVEIKLV